jgi:[acyl-carrier-protein] S-malonyltransferase
MTAYLFPDHVVSRSWNRMMHVRPDLFDVVRAAAGAHSAPDPRFELPAITALSLASWSALRPNGRATILLGHSVGELAALAAAGALSEEDAIFLAAERGRLVSAIADRADLVALAVDGTTPTAFRQLALSHGVAIANDNAPGAVVLSGRQEAIDATSLAARGLGLGAVTFSHAAIPSPMLAVARDVWREALAATEMRPPRLAVLSCVDARPIVDPRKALAAGLVAPVRFRQAVRALERAGVRRFVAIGPGNTLPRLVRQIVPRSTVETFIYR